MAASQTTTYKKRLRKSGLSPLARLVAATIADLRFEEGLDSREPLSLTMPALAEACGMKSKNTARRWLDEAIAAGWVIAASIYRDHRQQANQYFVVDPADHAEVNRLTSAIERSGARLLRSSGRPKPVKRLDTVLRSKNNGAGDDAAHCGGGGSDEQGHTETRPDPPGTAPASEGRDGPGAADGPPARAGAVDGEPLTEEQLLDRFAAESRESRLAAPPPRQTNVVAVEGDRLAASCHHCDGRRPVLSDLHRPPGAPRLVECLDCGRYWHKAPLRLVSA